MRQQLIHYLRSYYKLHSLLIKSTVPLPLLVVDGMVNVLESLTDEQVNELYNSIKREASEAEDSADVSNIDVHCATLAILHEADKCSNCPEATNSYCDVIARQAPEITSQAILVLLKDCLNLEIPE